MTEERANKVPTPAVQNIAVFAELLLYLAFMEKKAIIENEVWKDVEWRGVTPSVTTLGRKDPRGQEKGG